MKIGRSLVDLAHEIERQTTAKQDFIADTRKLHLVEDGHTLVADDVGSFQINDHALTQIGERVNIPTKYLRRMQMEAPKLLAANVNHWFQESPEKRMVRTLDGNARAFLSDRYLRIDNHDVANMTLPVLLNQEGLRIVSCEVTENKLYIKAVSTALEAEIKSKRVGDFVHGGVMISNSEVGLGTLSITPFAQFLVCTNGMTRDGGQKWRHLGTRAEEGELEKYLADDTRQADDRALLLKVRDTLAAAMRPDVFQDWIAKVQGSTEQKLQGDIPQAVELLGTKLTFSNDEKSSILRHLIEGGDLSQYGLVNAVTRTAEDSPSYDRATELEALGSSVLNLATSEWQVLAQAA